MIYLIRHGERKEQVKVAKTGKFYYDRTKRHSHSDFANFCYKALTKNFNDTLTAKGIQQTKDIIPKVKKLHITQIITSPFKRCIQTAKIISKELNIPYKIDIALEEREPYCKIQNLSDEEYKEHWDNYLNYKFKSKHIETCKDFVDRITNAFKKYKKEYGDDNILVIGHSCFAYAVKTLYSGIPENGFIEHARLDNCKLAKVL